jgi:prophage antirepressor-like protein
MDTYDVMDTSATDDVYEWNNVEKIIVDNGEDLEGFSVTSMEISSNDEISKKTFDFNGEDLEVFVVTCNGVLWMLANRFASILGYSRLNRAITTHVSECNQVEYKKIDPRRNDVDESRRYPSSFHPQTKFINEAGLFELIMKSKMKRATDFQDWITSTLLPSLKTKGMYNMVDAPIKMRSQLNAIHQITNEGTPAGWYQELTSQLAEANKMVMNAYETIANNAMQIVAIKDESHKALVVAKNETLVAYKKIIEIQPLIVAVPEDKTKFHVLEIFNMGQIDGKFCYRGIRAQQRSVVKLRPKDKQPILSIDSPNAMNAFNRIKDFIDCKTTRNEIFCTLAPSEFILQINKSLALKSMF